MSDKLRTYLHKIDTTAYERQERIIAQMMKAQGVTEQLKAKSQMRRVELVNQIRACVDEIIQEE